VRVTDAGVRGRKDGERPLGRDCPVAALVGANLGMKISWAVFYLFVDYWMCDWSGVKCCVDGLVDGFGSGRSGGRVG
jgi:hypothetical protein